METVISALKIWLQHARAQHLMQFAQTSAAHYSEVVERSHSIAHHPCMVSIRESLQQVVDLLQADQKNQIDIVFRKCSRQEQVLKEQIGMTEVLRAILHDVNADLQLHQIALTQILPEWREQVSDKSPLDDKVVRNDTAQRRLESIVALIQSCQTSDTQLSLMYSQMSRLYENLSTLRQVTYPIWQQKAINRTIKDDQAFLISIQQTIQHTGDIQP